VTLHPPSRPVIRLSPATCQTDPVHDAFELDPSVTHLNHGSFGAVPRVVSEAQRRVRDRAEANPMRFFRVEAAGLKEVARHTAADFLGVAADEVALVRNVTQSASTVLSSLAQHGRLGAGDVVLLGRAGYESVRRSVAHWCERTGASYAVVDHGVDASPDDVVDAYRRAIEGAAGTPRLVVIDEIASPTGTVLPAREVAALARAAGALSFVDGAHVPGHVPAVPRDVGADFWTGTWHKWGFAPRGTTALWVAEEERAGLEPLTTSWNHGQPFPLPFDMHGTDDYSAWFTLADAIAFWHEAGGLGIGERAAGMLDTGAKVVGDAVGAPTVAVTLTPAPCLRLVPLPDGVATTEHDADRLYEALSARRVEAQVVAYADRGWIRLSGAVYNEPADYERLADVLRDAIAAV
jgi:isopenicillin-N epimerase